MLEHSDFSLVVDLTRGEMEHSCDMQRSLLYRIAFKPHVHVTRVVIQIHLASGTVLVPGSTKMNETEIKMQTLWQMNLRDMTHVN